MRLDANTILITGGASGIGFALARRFIRAKSTVIVCGRRQEQLDLARRDCPELHTLRCDVSVERERIDLIGRVARDFPGFNVLINNAGLQQRPPPLLEAQDWNEHRLEMETNLHAPVHLSLLAITPLRAQPTAAIINIGSGLGFVPIARMPTYCATKAALHSFSLSLRHQLVATNIRVFEAVPPAVNTDLGGQGLHTFGVPLDAYADDVMEKLAADVPEFGYQFSDAMRLGSREELDARFLTMNKSFER